MTPPAAVRATRREWVGLAVLALPTLLVSMDSSILLLAVPEISEQLRPSAAQQLWIIDIYSFLVAGSLITMGTLGDRIGRRRLLLVGAAVFGIASALAAFSPSAPVLIAARALLGVAGATLLPSTLSLITNMFRDARQRTVAVAVWITCFSAGIAIGPLTGGLLLEHFWWGSVFLLGVPTMLLLMMVGPSTLPEYRDLDARGPIDVVSAALSLLAILGVVYGLKHAASDGVDPVSIAALIVGLSLAVLFVRRQGRLREPLMDLSLFRNRAFSASLVTLTFGILTLSGTQIFLAQFLQLVLDLSPLAAGLWTVPQALAIIGGTMLAPALVPRVRPTVVVAVGLAVAGTGFVVLTQVPGVAGLAVLVVGNIVVGLGLAPMMTLTTDLIVSTVPPKRAGSASALSETGGELGTALGVAVLGSAGAALYGARMATAGPTGLPADALDTARTTLGGAVAVAGQLPPDSAAIVLGPAREAFTEALHLVAGISAVVVLGLAVLVAVTVRDTDTDTDTVDADAVEEPVERTP